MNWRQLVVEPTEEVLPAVETWLEEAGSLALTLQDAGDQPLLEPPPGSMPLWRHTRLVALFPEETDMGSLTDALRAAFPAEALTCVAVETLEDRVWELEWRRDFRPMRFGQRLWVTPAEMRADVPAEALTLLLEPGLAFGTGTHPTTALCLRWLDARTPEGARVLDYGCGSGILAIAAALLGAAEVTATDIDPQALQATLANARDNEVAGRLQVLPPEALPARSYDIVLANIVAGTLQQLAPALSEACRPGGELVLSGLLADQVEATCASFGPRFAWQPVARLGDWHLVHGIRHADRLD